MRVVTEPDVLRMRINVYVELAPGLFLLADGSTQEVPAGQVPPVYVSMPERVAEALKTQLDGRAEPASARHLDDAIQVRDRLLAMVEATWTRRL